MSVLLRGAAWTYGAQVATVLLQLGYTSVTSHVIAPRQFGGYAVAILVVSLVTLLSNGGLGPAVTRMTELHRGRLINLMTFGIVLGAVIAIFTLLTAGFWAAFWGNPSAALLIRLLTVSVLLSPLAALVSGLIRRLGNFRTLAALTFGANAVGMLFGAAAAVVLRDGAALVVSPIVAQLGLVVGGYLSTRSLLVGLPRRRHGLEDARFGLQLTGQSLMSYVILNAGPWSIAQFMGAAPIGQWNRADALTTSPSYQLQNAVNSTLAPEFRHDIDNGDRARRVWTDLLALCAWFSLPVGVVVATVVPFLIPHLLGPRWDAAVQIAAVLGIAGGVKITVSVLGGALETVGRFRALWVIQVVLLIAQVPVIGAAFWLREPVVVAWGLLITNIAQHALQVAHAARTGYVEWRTLLRQYAMATVFSAVLFGICSLFFDSVDTGGTVGILAALVLLGAVLVSGYLGRRRLPPLVLFRRYRPAR